MTVSILVSTYNHGPYIATTLDGLLAQSCNFEYEILIGEDCSTDNTREICERYAANYPEQIKLFPAAPNMGGKKNFFRLLNAATGVYTAICEGDDYWTNPQKLQEQVDFLQQNPDFSICWTHYEIWENGSLTLPDWESFPDVPDVITLDNVFIPYDTFLLTVLFKSSALDRQKLAAMEHVKDNSIFCMCLSKGKGKLLPLMAGVYRVHGGGLYSQAGKFNQLFSSYQNFKELIQNIKECNNGHFRKMSQDLLTAAYYEAGLLRKKENGKKNIWRVYKEILEFCPLIIKLRATYTLVKYFTWF